MNLYFNDLMDWSDGARRTLDREREKMMERVELWRRVGSTKVMWW